MKKIFGLILVFVTVLAGCGSGATTSDSVPTITWYLIGAAPAAELEVEAAMNEILEKEVGAKIDIVFYDYGEYEDKMNMKFSANEEMDIIFASPLPFEENISGGKYIPLNEYLDGGVLGDTKEVVNEKFWDGVTIDDNIYAVPTNKEIATQLYYLFDSGLVEKYNFDISKVESMPDTEPFLKAVLEGEGYAPTTNDLNWNGLGKDLGLDCVASLSLQVCLDPNAPEKGYQWVYDIEGYTEEMKYVDTLIDRGYMKSDTLEIIDFATTNHALLKQEGFPGAEISWEKTFGHEYDVQPIGTPVVTTDSVRGSMNVISATSQNPEKAAAVINEVNTNAELRTIFAYGVEGSQWQYNADGKIEFLDGAGDYSVGVYEQGNFFILPLAVGEPEDKWNQFETLNTTSIESPALGFAPDLSAYSAELANTSNMLEKHKVTTMLANFNDADEDLAAARADLEKVGFFELIEEINRQYEEWKETN
ncbi:ABC transporter substrate-binding protein [Mollicutes bacterium LVI A0039]|nr:ABC transporter substrate-binding protein [Mollicutes bacterium LVI A0039]